MQTQAKRPVNKLAGPYGHPFHPIFVTVPIGAWVASFVFDLVSFRAGEAEIFVKASFWLIGLGILGALVAALFGVLDLMRIPPGTKAFKTVMAHMVLNVAVLALFAVGWGMRRGQLEQTPVAGGPLIVSVSALLLLAVAGWLGGTLAYRYGVRVATEEDQQEGLQ